MIPNPAFNDTVKSPVGDLEFSAAIRHSVERKREIMRIWAFYLLFCLVAVLSLHVFMLPHVPAIDQILGYLLLIICTRPVASHLARRGSGLPVFPIICLVYGVYYALPVFYLEPMVQTTSELGYSVVSMKNVTEALWLSIIGVTSMQVGFWFFRYSTLTLLTPRIRLPLESDNAKRWISAIGLLGMFVTWLELTHRIILPPSVRYLYVLLSQMSGLTLALFFIYYVREELSARGKAWFFVVLTIITLEAVATGFLRPVMDPFASLAAVQWMVLKKFPWKYMLAGALIFMLVQPIKGKFREQVWYQGYASSNFVNRFKLWGALFVSGWSEILHGGHKGVESSTRGSLGRTDCLHMFAYVLYKTPQHVPYQHGETYSYLLYALVPRFIWPDKPSGQTANDFFGVAYDFQDPESIGITSIGAPHLIESYVNFGSLGVIFVMLLIGIVYAAIDHLFNHPAAGEGGVAIYAVIITSMLTIETATAPTFGALIQTILVFAGILYFVRVKPPSLKRGLWRQPKVQVS